MSEIYEKLVRESIMVNHSAGVWWPYRLRTDQGEKGYIRSIERAIQSNLRTHLGSDLGSLHTIDIIRRSHDINLYPNLDSLLKQPTNGEIADIPNIVLTKDKEEIADLFENGHSFTRHDAAGSGSRLGLGPKFFLTPEKLIETAYKSKDSKLVAVMKKIDSRTNPFNELLSISFGVRHMLQHAFIIKTIAKDTGRHLRSLLQSPVNLVGIGENSSETIINEFLKWNFFGFNPHNTLFFIQKAHHGFSMGNDGHAFYDEASPKHLYNHGSMFLESFIGDGQVFRITNSKNKVFLSERDYLDILKKTRHMVSYNIADSQFLYSPPDYQGFSAALRIGEEMACKVIMEVVGQKTPPQRGGFWANDLSLNRQVMIESDQIGIPRDQTDAFKQFLSSIKFLNRNFNHILYPYFTIEALKDYGLPLHLTGIDGYLYPQPPQGDINFLVPTGFVKRTEMAQIESLKTINDIPETIKAMIMQDKQPGFKEFVQKTADRL